MNGTNHHCRLTSEDLRSEGERRTGNAANTRISPKKTFRKSGNQLLLDLSNLISTIKQQ